MTDAVCSQLDLLEEEVTCQLYLFHNNRPATAFPTFQQLRSFTKGNYIFTGIYNMGRDAHHALFVVVHCRSPI